MFYPRLCTISMTTKPIHVWWFSNWEACIRIARQIESISDSKILLQICIYSLEPVLVKKYPLILCMLGIYVTGGEGTYFFCCGSVTIKLRSEIVWHRFFAVPAFMRRFRYYIAVRKLFLKTSPNFSSRFRDSACFWQRPDILRKSEISEMRPQTKSSWRWLPHKIHQYSSICFTSLEDIFKLLKCNTPFTRILNALITS